MSRTELRVRLREIAMELVGYAKARSYEMYANAEDSDTRWAALQIAVRANEMMIAAATHSDPVASLMDMWALAVQWRHLFESEAGRELFPGYTDEMVANVSRIEGYVVALAEELTTREKVESGRARIEAWARDHALTTRMYRPTFTPEIAGFLPDRSRDIFSVAETLDESVSRVAMRLEILNAQLPQQIAWNAGMLVEKRLGDVDIEALAAQTERVMAMAEDIPQLLDTQRGEIFNEVDAMRGETIANVEVMRDDTLAEIDRQRMATIASLEAAVESTMDRIHDQSSLTVGEVEAIAVALVDDVNARVLATVDRAFGRLLILVGVLLAGAALIAVWSLRHPVRPAPER